MSLKVYLRALEFIIAVLIAALIWIVLPVDAFAAFAQVEGDIVISDGPFSFPTTFDTDLLMWSALVSQALPLAIARVVGTGWSKDAKVGASIITCLLASLVTAALLGKLDPANYITSALIVFTLTSIMYKQVWKDTETVDRLNAAKGVL